MKMKWLWIGLALIIVIVIVYFVFIKKKDNEPPVKEISDIKELHYSYSVGYSMNANYIYEIKCDDKCTVLIKPNGYSEEEAKSYEMDNKSIKDIVSILNKYEVSKWNGFNKSDPNVLDGDSFYFSVTMKNGEKISASGYMMWPDHYRETKQELKNIFDNYIKEGDFKEK